jgi:hypothetical protein
MKTRPSLIYLHSLIALAIVVGFPAQVIHMFELPMADWQNVGRHLPWTNITSMIFIACMAAASWNVSRYYFHWAAVATAAVVANNLFVGTVGLNYSLLQTTVASTLFVGFSLTPLWSSRMRRAYLNANLHWWKSAVRYSFKATVKINPGSLELQGFDISKDGIFLCSESPDYHAMRIGQKVTLTWWSHVHGEVKVKGVVSRTTGAHGQYPRGLAIVFDRSLTDSVLAASQVQPSIQTRKSTVTKSAS